MKKTTFAVLSGAAIIAAGCASMMNDAKHEQALAMMKASFKEQGQAKLDRLNQDETQRACSEYNAGNPIPKDAAARIEQEQLKTIKYPADGQYLGDWKEGEKIAQSGQGGQFSDDPTRPSDSAPMRAPRLEVTPPDFDSELEARRWHRKMDNRQKQLDQAWEKYPPGTKLYVSAARGIPSSYPIARVARRDSRGARHVAE